MTDLRDRIEEAATRYPSRRSAIMPALYLAQAEHGYLSGDVLRNVAEILDLPEVWVYELATFYNMFHTEPMGKYHLEMCTNISCLLKNAEDLLAYVQEKLGAGLGEMTGDELFTLSTVECLGACETAPSMQVNGEFVVNLTVEKLDALLAKLKAEAGN